MERLFSPCTRYQDMLESRGRLQVVKSEYDILKEVNLDVSTEELLSAERAFTYEDLHAMSGNQNTVLWLTPHAAVTRRGEGVVPYWLELDEGTRFWNAIHFSFSADGKDMFALARSPQHLLEICDVVLRLLAASVVHSLILHSRTFRVGDGALVNAPTLSYLMEQCPSLKLLSFKNIEMDENHCTVLGAYSRPDLTIELRMCRLSSAGAGALAEILGRNQGPTDLHYCFIDYSVIVDGLHGNSRLKSLTLMDSGIPEDVNRGVLAIASTLKENKSLVVLDLSYCSLSDETWDAVCDSLKIHPTLQVFNFDRLAPAVSQPRLQALVDMMKVNMSIHTIQLPNCCYLIQYEPLRRQINPYLETNRLRPRVRAIQRTRPIEYRAKVLGRALLAVRTDANSLWMLLSGNVEVAFSSITTMIKPATNLPTSATAVATFYATAAIAFLSRCLCSCK
jgi:hypothetical protein